MAKHKAEEPEVFCTHDEMAALDLLKPHPANPNTHPPEQIDLLAKVIRLRGWRLPITVSKRSGYIVRGHARLLAAQQLGLVAVPVDYQEYATEEDECADLVADNRISALAEFNDSLLRPLLLELQTMDFDMDLTGFDEVGLARFLAEPPSLTGGNADNTGYAPEELPPPDVSGLDTRAGRFLLVYTTEAEKEFWMNKLGVDGEKIMYTVADFQAESNVA